MDKYTVDIDKVLDAFEESEALQADLAFKTVTTPSFESSTFLNLYNSCEKVSKNQLPSDKPLSSSSVNNISVPNLVSKICDLPESLENSTKKCNLFEADFSPTETKQNMPSSQSSHAWNYEIYYKSFQPLTEPLNESKFPTSELNYQSTSSTSNNIKVNHQSYKKNDLLNCENQYNQEEVLCVAVERSDIGTKNTTSVASTLNTSTSPSEVENITDVKVNSETLNSASINESVSVRTCENSVSRLSEPESSSDERTCSSHNSSLASEKVLGAISSHVVNETNSNKADGFNLSVESNDILNNSSPYLKEADACSSMKSLCFSEIVEPVLSLQDMNEYLNDIALPDPVLDEDSGVSSQEDVNGNNLSIDLDNKENSFARLAVSSNSDGSLCKVSSDDQDIQNNYDDTSLKCITEEQENNPIHNKNDAIQNDDCNNKQIDINADIKQHHNSIDVDIVEGNYNAKCETITSTGAVPKQGNKQSSHSNLKNLPCSINAPECIPSVQTNCSIDQSGLTQTHFDVLDRTDNNMCPVKESLNLSNSSLLWYQQDVTVECNAENDANFLDSESLHTSTNVTDVLHNVNSSVCLEPTVSVNGQKQLTETIQECDSSVLIENLTHSPKLQRPTTLNLPFRNVSTSVTNHAVSSDVAPSPIDDSCDAPSEDASVETLLEDKNISEGSTEALLETHAVIHVPQIGAIKPFWIPDSDAANCMHCNIKFTVIKRRHHCRACGKVLCSSCCNQKARLTYLPNKENRVCQQCYDFLSASQIERPAVQPGESPASSSCGSSPSFSPAQVNSNFPQKGYWRPHPNNPDDYCSTISPLQQVQHLVNRPPPTVMVPVGVLKRGTKPRGEPKQVIFSDGIRPGGDLTDLTEPVELIPAYRRPGRRRVEKGAIDNEPADSSFSPMSLPAIQKYTHSKSRHRRVVVSDHEGPLPPILILQDQVPDAMFDMKLLIERLKDDQLQPVVFAVTKNLHILTKITKLDCYFGKECWCFTSHGLCTVAQDEVLFILERFTDEDVIPRDAFQLFSKLYDNACKGSPVNELGHIVFPDNIFGNGEHRGFLFVRPTFQILNQLVLPNTPFLVAILIQKWEVPWAKVFPLRLMLRLGEECRHYPCSLVSVRFRKPVYYKIGETIMSVLADLRNYQFTIPFVPGLVVHIEDKKTCVNIPRNRYEKLMKVLSSNNVEHVLALGANFSTEADSHLVCMQAENGDYVTQAMNIKNTTRKVTGASFIVFSGALKSSTGFSAKFSIVEDGLLIQIPQETMDSLHSALREMHDLTINCGPINSPDPEVVIIQWTKDDTKFNIGVVSPVDGKLMEGVPSLRIHASTDYAGENYLIRWTEVYFLEVDENANNKRIDTIDPCRLAETVAQACCMALVPYLNPLFDAEMTRIGLRVTLDTKRDKVEYDIGAHGQPLPSMYMNALDSNLIPVISRITGATQDEPIALELIFYVLIK